MRQTQNLPGHATTDKELSTFRRALPQFIAVGVKNLVLFGYGMTLGYPTIVIPALKGGSGHDDEDFVLTEDQISWFSSINLLCVPIGCFLSGFLTEPTGKRRAMQLFSVPMIISWLLFYFSTNIYHMYAGLCLSGLSGGLMEAPVLTYVAEVTQPQFRGMLAATGTTCVISGIFVQFIMGAFLKWRSVAFASAFLPIFTIIALFFVPESPYWLLTKGKVNEARLSLTWLRGWVPFAKVEQEFNEIYDVLELRRQEAEAAKLLPFYKRAEPFTRRGFIAPFILVSATFFIGHFSGKTPLQTYAVQIFATLKAPIDKYYATVLLGAAELIGAFACVLLVHLTGKRPLVFASLIGTAICFFATATYAFYLNDVPGIIVDNVVANRSMEINQRSSIVNENNLTDFANAVNKIEFMDQQTTTDSFLTTYEYEYSSYDDILANETTNDEFEGTTLRYKRMHVFENETNESETAPSGIILAIPNAEENKYAWIPLTLLIVGSILSHVGIRVIPWMLIGEVFPVNVRSAASGLSSGLGYTFAFLSNKLFLSMVASMTFPGTFWFYSAVAICGCIVLYFVLPETEGRKLIDIEAHFTGKKSLSENETKLDDRTTNGDINNKRLNGFDMVTIVPQSVFNQNYQNGNSLPTTPTEINAENLLSVPEILVNQERSLNAGSKRYKHRVTDTMRSRNSINSINSVDEFQGTRL